MSKRPDPLKLFKTTIVIWTESDPWVRKWELPDLAQQAMGGEGYCSKQLSEKVLDARDDPDWIETEFFDLEGDT